MQNFLRQFRRDEMIAVGAFYCSHRRSRWKYEWPRLYYGMLQPPSSWRGARWIRGIQWPYLFIISLILCISHQCDTILAVYPDGLFLLTGYLISRLLKKPLYVYFHNTFLDNYPSSKFASWLQNRIFRHSKHVFVMSQGMYRFFRERYPKLSCSVLSHIIPEIPELNNGFQLTPLHSPLRLMFVGNINELCREAASRFAQLIQTRTDLALKIYSGMSPKEYSTLGFCIDRVTIENVPYDELIKRMHEADVIIHPHGFYGGMKPIEYQTIFPTKTLEYLISLKPILAHAPENCYLSEFYRDHDCALLVHEPSVEALESGLQVLISDESLRLRLVKNALKAAEQFRSSKVIQSLKEEISRFEGYQKNISIDANQS